MGTTATIVATRSDKRQHMNVREHKTFIAENEHARRASCHYFNADDKSPSQKGYENIWNSYPMKKSSIYFIQTQFVQKVKR